MKKVNLFFIKNNEIAVFRLKNIKNGEKELELLKNQGEIFQSIDSKFWTWWEEKVGFLSDDETDFCFVWDKESVEIMSDARFRDKTHSDVWSEETLTRLFEFFKINGKIISNNGVVVGNKNSDCKFFTNLVIDKTKINANSYKKHEFKTYTNNETDMQKYFRQMCEREARQRSGQ